MVLSPKPIQPEQVIPVAIPTSSRVEIKSNKMAPATKNNTVAPSISQLKQALESKNNVTSTIQVARPSLLNKEIPPLNSRYPSEIKRTISSSPKTEEVLSPENLKKETTTEIKTKTIDKSLLNKYNNSINDNAQRKLPELNSKPETTVKERRNIYPPTQQSTPLTAAIANRGLEARKQALFTSNSLDNKNIETITPKKDVQSRYRPNNFRESSTDSSMQKEKPLPSTTLLKTRPPPRVSSLPSNDTQNNNFLLEAKQKLFTVQQQQRQMQTPAKKTLPIAPIVREQSGHVVS